MKKTVSNIPALILSVIFFLNTGCSSSQQPLPMVEGPETELVQNTRGNIIIQHRLQSGTLGGLTAITLPHMREIQIYPKNKDVTNYFVGQFSGPDNQGRICFIGNSKDPTLQKTELKIININDNTEEVFASELIQLGKSFSLSPVKGLVTLLKNIEGIQMPGAYIQRGKLEIWNINNRSKLQISADALDEGISWFPHAERLVYIDLVRKEEIPNINIKLNNFGTSFRTWHMIPMAIVLEVNTGRRYMIHPGIKPIVSPDGRKIILMDFENKHVIVNLETKEVKTVNLPGSYGGVIAWLDKDLILYWALPTKGAPVIRSPYGSFKAGLQMITIKLSEINSNRFQTVIPAIDPRHSISFGIIDSQ